MASTSHPVTSTWWESFNDPVLTAMIEEARAKNLDIRLAAFRMQEAAHLDAAQRGSALPSLAVGGEEDRAKTISDVTGRPYLAVNRAGEFEAAYEVDLWGRISSLGAAALANEQASVDAVEATSLSVTAAVANGYINLRALDARLGLDRQTLASRQSSLRIARTRQNQGYSSALETAQAEVELRATAEVIPQDELARTRQEEALNVLLGRKPGPIDRGSELVAITSPMPPSLGLPSDLLRRRPDIAQAERQLAASDAQFEAARAQLLPAVRLTASYGAFDSSILRRDPFSIWSVGASILAPLFNGGQLRSLAKASGSRRDQALAVYQKTVLTAFSEVETLLAAYDRQCEELVEAARPGRCFREHRSNRSSAKKPGLFVEPRRVACRAEPVLGAAGGHRLACRDSSNPGQPLQGPRWWMGGVLKDIATSPRLVEVVS